MLVPTLAFFVFLLFGMFFVWTFFMCVWLTFSLLFYAASMLFGIIFQAFGFAATGKHTRP